MVIHSDDEEGWPGSAEPTRSDSPTQPLPGYEASEAAMGQSPGEVQRLREELASANNRLDTRAHRQRRVTMLRQIVAALLVVVATLGVTMSVIGVWAAEPR